MSEEQRKPQTPEEWREWRGKSTSDEPFYKQTWFVVIAVIVACGVIGNLMNLDDSSSPPRQQATQQTQQQAAAEAEAQREREERAREQRQRQARLEELRPTFDQWQQEGLVPKIDAELREVYVSPILWRTMNIEQKEQFTRIAAEYCGLLVNDPGTIVDIYDYQSGKRLAKIGVFGFKVY